MITNLEPMEVYENQVLLPLIVHILGIVQRMAKEDKYYNQEKVHSICYRILMISFNN